MSHVTRHTSHVTRHTSLSRSVEVLGGGNINDSFLVHCASGGTLVLQRINSSVFPDVSRFYPLKTPHSSILQLVIPFSRLATCATTLLQFAPTCSSSSTRLHLLLPSKSYLLSPPPPLPHSPSHLTISSTPPADTGAARVTLKALFRLRSSPALRWPFLSLQHLAIFPPACAPSPAILPTLSPAFMTRPIASPCCSALSTPARYPNVCRHRSSTSPLFASALPEQEY